MNFLIGYLILSAIFTIFVIATCMLSSQLSCREQMVEVYAHIEPSQPVASDISSRSSW